MDEDDIQRSPSGSPIYVYGERKKPFELAVSSSEDVEKVEEHIEKHVGKIDTVWHELVSDLIHLDVHHIPPTTERNLHTFVTSGMSDLPMSAPEGAEGRRYAELLITLPPNWPVSDEAFKDDKNYWPIQLLKVFARFPHEYATWLWWGHTIPNGNPPEPLHSSVGFIGAILAPPIGISQEFMSLECSPDKTIHFFSVIPLYQDEMDLKLQEGMDPLFDRFDQHKLTDIIDVNRKNVGKKSWWPFA